MERFAALKAAQQKGMRAESEYWLNDNPRCPHCGEDCDISKNDWWRLYEEGEHDVDCPHCDDSFTVSTRVSYTFSTDKQGK